ncbi:RNA dependent RNA polymerase-domain-containing protein [Gautieria morchelliformis]|nr:RNA dependent RNA polymerase-domain-containing protein [Gautieria morchelliformis]
MPKPIGDDSGYYETVSDSEDGGDCNPEPYELLDVPGEGKLRRATSISSIHSQISRGSSQLWDGMLTPDESAIRDIDDAGAKLLEKELEEVESSWRRRDEPIGIDVTSLKHPSGPGHVEVRTLHPDSSNRTYCLGKRSLSERDDPFIAQGPAQRRKPEGLGREDISARLFHTSQNTDVFLRDSSSAPKPPLILIAHSDRHQPFFNKYQLSWGVQWEIARLVSSQKLRYDDIPLYVIKKLAGPNAVAAPRVERLLRPQKGEGRYRQTYEEAFERELNTRLPWAELDKEEAALNDNPLSGLGCNSLQDDWYGGKIAFIARLRQNGQSGNISNNEYRLELDSPELSASTRFFRRWGSRRFVRVRIPESVFYRQNNRLLTFFKNNFVIHGRVFRAFYAKDHSVFLFELPSTYSSGRLQQDPHGGRISLAHFLEWHNPMAFNKDQSLAKWCARMALGLSNSAPGVEILAENCIEIDDLYSPAGQTALKAERKPESKDIMTDGEGYTNMATLVQTKYKFNWDLVPCAIQYRLGGAKGLLLLHPEDNGSSDEPFRVWIRPSQTKIVYHPNLRRDRAHLVLDVLRRSQLKHPARLSTEIIVNLAQNGVTYDVFEGLMSDGLQGIATSLTQWSGHYAMQNLWAIIAGVNGSVIRSRMSREAAGSSRVLGFGSRDKDDEEQDDDEDAVDIPTRSKAWWPDEFSGCPSSLEETAMVLLDSGFQPQSCGILAMKLKEVFKKALNSYIEKYKIVVPRSAEAWIVPDPCNVLEAGEIFLKSSENIVGQDDLITDHLLGDVLVTRHPCCVPSDVQKVRAVWRDELRKYRDVIIFSVRGERSLASMLGGGDYDGDTAHVIWEPSIVKAFRNPDDKFADPPLGIDDAFERDTMTVDEFLEKHKAQHDMPVTVAESLQDYLLASLKDVSLVGQYSNWHDIAVYKYGYEHDEAWRLAYMFCAVLDSSKTGKTVKTDILTKDRLSYKGCGKPAWKESILEPFSNLPPQDEPPRRLGKMTHIKFIMDHLKEAGRKKYHHHMAEFEKFLVTARQAFKAQHGITSAASFVDPELEAPWLQAVKRAGRLIEIDKNDRMKRELEIIRRHVEAVREKHREYMRQEVKGTGKGRTGRSLTSPRKDSPTFTEKPIEQRQNILRELSLSFSQMPADAEFIVLSPEEVKRCRASYAYVLETEHQEKRFTDSSRFSRFPFDVAMRDLCHIKAQSAGSWKTVNSGFYSTFNMTGAIKAFRSADCPAYTYAP